jgi:hypothetical protein
MFSCDIIAVPLDSAHFELRRRSSAPIETLLTATKHERLFSRGGGAVSTDRSTWIHRNMVLQYLENTGTQNGSCNLEPITNKFFLAILLFSSVKAEKCP